MPWTGKGQPSSGCYRTSPSAVKLKARTLASRAGSLLLTSALAACTGIQSALDPRGPASAIIADLSWVLFAGATVIFLLVVGILGYVLCSKAGDRGRFNHHYFIAGGGVVLPVVVLSALLVFVFRVGAELTAEPGDDALRVEVTGYQWWWEFRYIGEEPQQDLITANELHIPVGRPVELQLKSADVIHSFWVPNLAGKRDLIPGMTNTLNIQADSPGLFRGMCNEFCGAQHTLMNLYVISEPDADFQRWLDSQREPAQAPTCAWLEAGEAAFLKSGCPVCHTVRGTEARGRTGPDLTHFGSRRSIAAGTMRNTRANRIAWVASPQHIKPENKMPEFRLDSESLRPLADYLGSLE